MIFVTDIQSECRCMKEYESICRHIQQYASKHKSMQKYAEICKDMQDNIVVIIEDKHLRTPLKTKLNYHHPLQHQKCLRHVSFSHLWPSQKEVFKPQGLQRGFRLQRLQGQEIRQEGWLQKGLTFFQKRGQEKRPQ